MQKVRRRISMRPLITFALAPFGPALGLPLGMLQGWVGSL